VFWPGYWLFGGGCCCWELEPKGVGMLCCLANLSAVAFALPNKALKSGMMLMHKKSSKCGGSYGKLRLMNTYLGMMSVMGISDAWRLYKYITTISHLDSPFLTSMRPSDLE